MRILVHDYSGHAFPVQLSRELARRGHEILHVHCPSYHTGKGALARVASDPPRFAIEGVALDRQFQKHSPTKRFLQERQYGLRVAARIERYQPHVVLSGNTPLLSQSILLSRCRKARIGFVFWLQDVTSVAIARLAASRVPVVGSAIAGAFVMLERRLVRLSDAVVAISEDFVPLLREWRVAEERIHVIHNWAPLAELPVRPRDNAWAAEHRLVDKRVILYSGTLGLKHNPELLLALAAAFRDQPDVVAVVVSEGRGAEWLAEHARQRGLSNLLLLGFQPYERLPDVLASADVLVAILEPDAAVFSVPSKVLTYHCAGKPLLAAVPQSNLAARLIERAGSGLVVDPAEVDEFVTAAATLLADDDLRRRAGRRARRYAATTFDIKRVSDRFERILEVAAWGSR